ncbi:PWWP domain-containing protein [Histoplasma ohiense]|nr:PWWP domain-containing protein [Histoplasma ohiense (nom. inval.)]
MAEDANPAASRINSAPRNTPSADAAPNDSASPHTERDEQADVKPENALAGTKATASENPGSPVTEAAKLEPPAGKQEQETDESGVAVEETAEVAAPTGDGANGTPSASKKSSNGKRKSTGGVDSKGKKLNKKKSAARITHLDAKPGEYYTARLKSYAPWPSIICDEEMLPPSLLSTRPVTTKQKDGTYKEAYSDGGKRVHERTFPIMFLYTNEFAWIPNTDLTPLDPESCKDVNEKGKTKSLVEAYRVAAENHDLQYFKDMLADHQRALEQDQEEREARAAAKAAKQEKKKRKSIDVADEQEDEAADVETEKRKSTKKRKKDVESDAESDKPAKTPKTATKLKLTTPKTPATGESGKKTSAKPSKTKVTSAKKAKKEAKATSDGDTAEASKESEVEKPLNPQEAKLKKEKEVLYLRHKLQKGFLTRDQAPKAEEMASMSNFIQKLESYADLEVSIIRTTKINKVLKAIIKLNSIPKDEEFNFRRRSINILNKWTTLLDSDIPPAREKEEQEPKPKPKANGHKQVNGQKMEEATDANDSAAVGATTQADEDEIMPDAPEVKTPADGEKSGSLLAKGEAEAMEV